MRAVHAGTDYRFGCRIDLCFNTMERQNSQDPTLKNQGLARVSRRSFPRYPPWGVSERGGDDERFDQGSQAWML